MQQFWLHTSIKVSCIAIALLFFTSCKKNKLVLKASGNVTEHYTQAAITSGFVRITSSYGLESNLLHHRQHPSGYDLRNRTYGAVINADGSFNIDIEELGGWPQNWHVTVYNDSYISEPYELTTNTNTTLNIACKPLRTLAVSVDFGSNFYDKLALDVLADEKTRNWRDQSGLLQNTTYYFKVIPDAPCVITSNVRSSGNWITQEDTLQIMNVDTSFYDIVY